MSIKARHYPASARVVEAIDRKRRDQAFAHHCAGFDCATCSWKTNDLAEMAGIIDRELSVGAIVLFLHKLQELRGEVETAIRSSVGHPLAVGGGNRLEGIIVRPALFDESRALLKRLIGRPVGDVKHPDAGRSPFTLRPLVLPLEAHLVCEKCAGGAVMAEETAAGTNHVCYLHAVEIVLEEEVRGRTR